MSNILPTKEYFQNIKTGTLDYASPQCQKAYNHYLETGVVDYEYVDFIYKMKDINLFLQIDYTEETLLNDINNLIAMLICGGKKQCWFNLQKLILFVEQNRTLFSSEILNKVDFIIKDILSFTNFKLYSEIYD